MSAPVPDVIVEQQWREVTGTDVPLGLNGMLLKAALAHERQCKDHGGLSLGDVKRLTQAGRKERDSRNRTTANSSVAAVKSVAVHSLLPSPTSQSPVSSSPSFTFGTQFVREWKGRDEIVTVVDGGFLWNGQVYASLSAAARAITGTRWNGPRFFGVGTKRAKP